LTGSSAFLPAEMAAKCAWKKGEILQSAIFGIVSRITAFFPSRIVESDPPGKYFLPKY